MNFNFSITHATFRIPKGRRRQRRVASYFSERVAKLSTWSVCVRVGQEPEPESVPSCMVSVENDVRQRDVSDVHLNHSSPGPAIQDLGISSARQAAELKQPPRPEVRRLWRRYSLAEVAKHCTLRDGWIIVHERIFDISAFATTHPGFNNAGQVSTALAIARMLGKDATDEFEEIHSDKAWRQLLDFQIGVLAKEGETLSDGGSTKKPPVPSWLSKERDFWVAYADGVSASVLRYLEANGYPQHEKGRSEHPVAFRTKRRQPKSRKESHSGAHANGGTAAVMVGLISSALLFFRRRPARDNSI